MEHFETLEPVRPIVKLILRVEKSILFGLSGKERESVKKETVELISVLIGKEIIGSHFGAKSISVKWYDDGINSHIIDSHSLKVWFDSIALSLRVNLEKIICEGWNIYNSLIFRSHYEPNETFDYEDTDLEALISEKPLDIMTIPGKGISKVLEKEQQSPKKKTSKRDYTEISKKSKSEKGEILTEILNSSDTQDNELIKLLLNDLFDAPSTSIKNAVQSSNISSPDIVPTKPTIVPTAIRSIPSTESQPVTTDNLPIVTDSVSVNIQTTDNVPISGQTENPIPDNVIISEKIPESSTKDVTALNIIQPILNIPIDEDEEPLGSLAAKNAEESMRSTRQSIPTVPLSNIQHILPPTNIEPPIQTPFQPTYIQAPEVQKADNVNNNNTDNNNNNNNNEIVKDDKNNNNTYERTVPHDSSIIFTFEPILWKMNAGAYQKTFLNVIQHIWKKAVEQFPERGIYKERKITGMEFAKFRFVFVNTDGKFPAAMLSDFASLLTTLSPQLYDNLISIYFEGNTVFGPKHRHDCIPSRSGHELHDEICVNNDEMEQISDLLYPSEDIPTTRAGLLDFFFLKLGKDQRQWQNNIMLDFYQLLWSITSESPFQYKESKQAKQYFEKEKIITHESKVWPVAFQNKNPHWQFFTQPRFGSLDIQGIYANYLKAANIVVGSLKPEISTKNGLLQDIDIDKALQVYTSDPDYKFHHYMVRIPYGLAEGTEEFNPISPMYLVKPEGVVKFGFVLNTQSTLDAPIDPNQKLADQRQPSGSHWVAFFVDTSTSEMNYMDSYARRNPNPKVVSAIQSAISLLNTWFPSIELKYENITVFTKPKQKLGIECGVYVTHYIIQRLLGKTMQELDDAPLPDTACSLMRNVYWRI